MNSDERPSDQEFESAERAPLGRTRRPIREAIAGIAITAFVVWAIFGTIHTHLGVKAVSWDKDGREHIWRVWWRARDEIISNDSPLFVVLYLFMALAVVLLSGLAVWIALVAEDPDTAQHTNQ